MITLKIAVRRKRADGFYLMYIRVVHRTKYAFHNSVSYSSSYYSQ